MPKAAEASTSRRRLWLFRCLAVLLGLVPLLLFEIICIAAGWGQPGRAEDPLVGFDSIRPLFVLNDAGDRYEIPEARQRFFNPQSFARQKPANEFRIFVLGGSTVNGRPYAHETSFAKWLEIRLAKTDPSRNWRVINCGGVSYASYRLTPVLEEVLQHDADLVILYTGHNEFLEDRTFDHIKNRSGVWNSVIQTAGNLRTFNVARAAFLAASDGDAKEARPLLPTEVQALLDYRGGLEKYHRDEAWQQGVMQQYRYNVQQMVQQCRASGTPLILINPAANLRDSPPFKSQHSSGLSDAELRAWQQHFDQARKYFGREEYNLHRAATELEQACEIDPLHAGAWYTLARCYEETGRADEAKEAYILAKDLDICPLRILQPMQQTVHEISQQEDVLLIDAQDLFAARSRNGITGSDWFLDHVHPSIRGHQLLAGACADKMLELNLAPPPADEDRTQAAIEAAYADHLQSIGSSYYQTGAGRLQSLKEWAAGRAVLPPEDPSAEK